MISRVSGISMRIVRSMKLGMVNRIRVSTHKNTFSKFPLNTCATRASTTSTRKMT